MRVALRSTPPVKAGVTIGVVGMAIVLALVAFAAPPVAAEYQLGERILSFGSWGADVFRLQQMLIQAGYDLEADGHYGSGTKSVVTAFQLAHGLTPDGAVGPQTLAVLSSKRSTMVYVVKPGDSLWKLAREFDTTMEQLIITNNLPDGPLLVGQELLVPVRPVYKVQPGDTLWEIAIRFNTTVARLAEINGISDPSRIRAGMELRIP